MTSVPSIGASKYIKQILTDLKWKTDSNTVTAEDFNTSLLLTDRSFRNVGLKQHIRTDGHNKTYKEHDSQKQQNTHSTQAHMEHSSGQSIHQATSLNELKTTKMISSIFSEHNVVKLEINYKKKTGKFTNIWRLNNMLLNQWVKEEIKK